SETADESLPDLSFLGELAEVAASDPNLSAKEFLAKHAGELRRGFLSQQHFTKKTQALARLREEAQTRLEDARSWEALMKDAVRRRAVLKVMENPEAVLESEDVIPIPSNAEEMTTQELIAYVAKKTRDAVLKEVEERTQSRRSEPSVPDVQPLEDAFEEATWDMDLTDA